MIDFWTLAKASQGDESGYFDETLQRALELECGLPFNSIAWVKSQWPGIEFYLYDTTDLLQSVRNTDSIKVTSVRRPEDHGQMMGCDWVVHLVQS